VPARRGAWQLYLGAALLTSFAATARGQGAEARPSSDAPLEARSEPSSETGATAAQATGAPSASDHTGGVALHEDEPGAEGRADSKGPYPIIGFVSGAAVGVLIGVLTTDTVLCHADECSIADEDADVIFTGPVYWLVLGAVGGSAGWLAGDSLSPGSGSLSGVGAILVGSAVLAAGLVVGYAALDEARSAKRRGFGGDQAREFALEADIVMGAGLLAIGVGVVGLFTGVDEPKPSRASLFPFVSSRAAGVALRGSY